MKILVVDDEEDIAEELADFLESPQREVQFETSARRALDLAKAMHPDLVITDMRMPELDGAELAIRIAREVDSSTRFIIVSGHLHAEEELASLSEVQYALVPKPVDIDALTEQVALCEAG